MTDTTWESAPIVGVVHEAAKPSMDPKVRDLFVKALQHSFYREKQGYDRLYDGTNYTALGVLCDLATKLSICTWDSVDGEFFIAPMNPPATGAYLPPLVREWAKINRTHPSQELPLLWEGNLHPIWRLSDIHKLDFPTIAGLIQDQY